MLLSRANPIKYLSINLLTNLFKLDHFTKRLLNNYEMLVLTGFRCRRIETGLKDSENLSAEFKIGLNRSCSQWQQRSWFGHVDFYNKDVFKIVEILC